MILRLYSGKPLEKNGNAIIIAHNHPSGDLEPSQEDITITEALKKGGNLINLKVLDHVIFSEENYKSIVWLFSSSSPLPSSIALRTEPAVKVLVIFKKVLIIKYCYEKCIRKQKYCSFG